MTDPALIKFYLEGALEHYKSDLSEYPEEASYSGRCLYEEVKTIVEEIEVDK